MNTFNDLAAEDFLQRHYEFEKLQRFIQVEIYEAHYPLNDKLIPDFKAIVIEEVEVIKQKLIAARVRFQSEFFLEMYVQSRQRSLIQMTGALLQHTQAEHIIEITQTRGAEVFCQYLYRVLQDLLGFLQNQYPRYFDQNAWIPASYRQILIQGFRMKLPVVEKNLQLHNIDPELVIIILQPVRDFMTTDDSNAATYQKIIYLNELLDLLEAFTPIYPSTDAHQTLHDLLLAFSFNSFQYFAYRIKDIEAGLTPATPLIEQIETLLDEGKKIRQHVFTTGLTLNSRYPTLQEQLLEWIESTADALFKIHKLYTSAESMPSTATDEKFPLQDSIEKLAVWARILYDHAESKKPKSIKPVKLFRFIARNFQTVQTTNMSTKNLSNLFYTPEPSAVAAVVEDLLQLRKIGEGLRGKK